MIRKIKQQWVEHTLRYIIRYYPLILLFGCLLAGVLLGALFVRTHVDLPFADVSVWWDRFLSLRRDAGILSIALRSFWTLSAYLLVAYCAGLFAYGAAIAAALPLVRGMGIGVVCGYLYQTFGLKGGAFSALVVVPPAFLSCLILAAICRESMSFSLALFRRFFRGGLTDAAPADFKKYNIRCGVFLLLSAAVAVSDGIVSGVFTGAFGF